jgi:hypothetical protein
MKSFLRNVYISRGVRGLMTYNCLKNVHLKDMIGFYPNQETYLLRNRKEKTIAEMDS